MICSVNVNFVRRPHLSTPKAVYGLNSADNTPPPSPHPCLGLYNYSHKLANRQKNSPRNLYSEEADGQADSSFNLYTCSENNRTDRH